ncbi:conjugal transfer protein [Bacteroidia bacterium]|nr:conjugal transfer protein [Bacteroidia bacterium]
MKRFVKNMLYTLLLGAIVCVSFSCSHDDLDILTNYGYSVETLPLPKKLKQGESVALEFSILREGYYSGTSYKFRYFQSEGSGILTYKGKAVPVNRFQDITSDDFVLTYQSTCEEQQQLDFVFLDSFGKQVDYSITFASERTEKE